MSKGSVPRNLATLSQKVLGVTCKYKSSGGKTMPLNLSMSGRMIDAMDREELGNTIYKLAPLVVVSEVQRALLDAKRFVRFDTAQWVTIKTAPADYLNYGECATLTNAAIAEVIKDDLYKEGKIIISEFSFEPKPNVSAEGYGLDHVCLLVEDTINDNRIIIDPLFNLSCPHEEYLRQIPILNYYGRIFNFNEEETSQVLQRWEPLIVPVDNKCIVDERVQGWKGIIQDTMKQDIDLQKILHIFKEALSNPNSKVISAYGLSMILAQYAESEKYIEDALSDPSIPKYDPSRPSITVNGGVNSHFKFIPKNAHGVGDFIGSNP